MNSYTTYWTRELKKLVGGTIIKPVYTKGDYEYDDEFWGIEVRIPNGEIKLVWILRDEEGNGPGAVDIVDNYYPQEKDDGVKYIEE